MPHRSLNQRNIVSFGFPSSNSKIGYLTRFHRTTDNQSGCMQVRPRSLYNLANLWRLCANEASDAAGLSILIDADGVRTSEASAGVLRNESTVAVTGSVASGRFITQK
jgi:hypothetical protein